MFCPLILYAMSFGVGLFQRPEGHLPDPDRHGRYATFTKKGFSDPESNIVVDKFINWAILKTPEVANYREQKKVLEIGGAFGFTAARAIRCGAHYLFNDECEEQVTIAESRFDTYYPSQVESLIGIFPTEIDINRIQAFHPLIGVGSFMVLHFLRPEEIRSLFAVLWDLLEPGGKVFITTCTPWNAKLKGFPEEFARRKERFLASPATEPYPGEIENVWKYFSSDHYPKYFHALDAELLEKILAGNPTKPFKTVETHLIERPNPPDQAYTKGYPDGQTEILGMIFQKPATAPPVLR